ncbi:MAG TPA: prolyl-tRNA synthetase associated domain-containing protein [Acidobacteriota bacterium]|nr:prolyl-tRNA synthetase associated domain-containing protein [Acidobacteriota bacterium]
MSDIEKVLDGLGIGYRRYDHPAVYTVEQVEEVIPDLPGAKTKNLFLRDRKGRRHFLIVVAARKRVDLKACAQDLGAGKLSFASEERLRKHLGVDAGAVTLLALINDSERQVEVFIDRAIWESEEVQCHPLVNTATLVLSHQGLRDFLAGSGHDFQVLDVPSR